MMAQGRTYRKDQEDVGRDLNDLLINRLIVEELNALVVNIGVCTLQNRGDNAAVTQGVIIGLGAAAEGVCEEGLCQINIAAVGSDVQAAAAVGGIALAAVQRRNGGDHLPNLDAMIENFDKALSHPDADDLEQLKQAVK